MGTNVATQSDTILSLSRLAINEKQDWSTTMAKNLQDRTQNSLDSEHFYFTHQ